MRIRILVVLLLLALVVAPSIGHAGDLSRTPVSRASLTKLWTEIAYRIIKLLQLTTDTVRPSPPKEGVVTDGGACVDPMGHSSCGS